MAELAAGMSLDVGGATDVGRVRNGNEDALLTLVLPPLPLPLTLVAVADGMGGHAGGEVASAIAVRTLGSALAAADEPARQPGTALRRSVEQANRAVWQAARADPALAGMGTTLVAALIGPDSRAAVANVGDSRAYLVSAHHAERITEDHTWVAEQVMAGEITQHEARTSPFRSMLTRSVGSASRVEVDVFEGVELGAAMALVLCSDGVTEYLDERDLARALGAARTAQGAAEAMVRLAVGRGGADNATVVVAWRREPIADS